LARARNKILVFLLKLAVSAGSLYIVFSKTDIHGVMAMLKEIGVVFFLVASLLYITAQYVSSWRWKMILPDEYGVGKLFSLYLIGSFFSSFLPGVIGGDVVKAYYLNKDAKKIGMTIASVFMDRYLGYLSLVTIGIVSFPFALPYFGGSIYRWIMPAIFVSFVLGSLLFFGLRIGRGFRSVSEFYNYFSELWKRKDLLLWAFILSFLIQFLNYFMVVIFAYAIGEHIPLLLLFVFLPIIITLTTIPISISGLGVREGAFVVLLGLIGVKPEISASLSLSWFFSTFVGSLPGLFAYLRYGSKGGENG
jgi:uncharacterized membrane protein YbhN (UPF0104 family)